MNDVWRITGYDTYTTREFKTASGCAKAVARFTKGQEVSNIDFQHYQGETGWVWAATIVLGP